MKKYMFEDAKLPTKFSSLKELYERLPCEVKFIIEYGHKYVNFKFDKEKMAIYLIQHLPKIKDLDDVEAAFDSFMIMGNSHKIIKEYANELMKDVPLTPKTKPDFVNKMYVVAFSMIYDKIYFNENIANKKYTGKV